VTERGKELFAQFEKVARDYEQQFSSMLSLAAGEKLHELSPEMGHALAATRKHADVLDATLNELAEQKEVRAKEAAHRPPKLVPFSNPFIGVYGGIGKPWELK
jgi:hypothetical protein